MPTGYTALLIESKTPMSLRDFALGCARAFGACVTMRDAPMDAPIPKAFEPDTSYHDKGLKKAKAILKRLPKMTKAQRTAFNKRERAKKLKTYTEMLESRRQENARLQGMRIKVMRWQPLPEIVPLKTFMLQQIDVSLEDESYWVAEIENATSLDYYSDALERATKDVAYHTEQRAEEIRRTEARNAWLKALYDSLPAN